MRVLLLRPPRYLWPFNSRASAFWPPLGLLCLAAAVRREMPEVDICLIDAPGERCGWRSLEQRLADERIDVLGIGEETVSAHEGLRAAALVKRLWPECTVVAGGMYHAHAIEATLDAGCVDVIVRGEGEETFVDLLRHIHNPGEWGGIRGLAFRDFSGRTVVTPPRPLTGDLDRLPMPAYDLLDLGRYGRGSRNHPALVSIEHSRGCIDSCSFCILWKHMGEPVGGNGEVRPRLRTKSPERSFDEVMRLHRDFGRRTFGWVDPTFNASAEWEDRWADLMLGSRLAGPRSRARTLHTAWMRADGVVRDERLGILEKVVRAGLRQVVIGVERFDATGLAALNKHNNDAEVCRRAFAIFREKYPQVYTIGSMIFGLPGDSARDLRRLAGYEAEMGMDYCFIIPLTPNPGTDLAASAGQYVANADLSTYNFHTPVCRTNSLDLRDLENLYWRVMLSPSRKRIGGTLRRLFCERDPRRRRVHAALVTRGASIAVKSLLRALFRPRSNGPTLYSRRPSWYDK